MALTVVGVSHRTAALDVRERLMIGPSDLHAALEELRAKSGAGESVIVSTCNRTELYFTGTEDTARGALEMLSRRIGDRA